MVNKEKILLSLDQSFTELKAKHLRHKERVSKAVDWFIKNDLTPLHEEPFVNHCVKYKKADCMIIEVNLKGVPFFECYFIIYPCRVKDDIGKGKGCAIKLEF